MAAYCIALMLMGMLVSVHSQGQQPAPIQYMILEELPPGTMIGNVATDARLIDKYELRVLRQLRFRFLVQPDMVDLNLFSIEETSGIIETTQRIDRDTMCPEKPACFVSLDVAVGPAQYFQVISVQIEVLDKNDNTPQFPQPTLRKSMSEATLPGTAVSIPPAVDPDSTDFAIKSYQLVSDSDAFQLVETPTFDGGVDLRLKLISALDREARDFYQMKVLAIDGGDTPRSGSIVVNITITDANDNSPVFTNNTYEVYVKEDVHVNNTLITVHANDADVGKNSEVIYRFTGRTTNNYGQIFGLNSNTGAITLKKPLDFEELAVYHLVVRAEDQGPNSQPSHATVVIHVLDVNDNAPRITVNTLTSSQVAEISEASPPETFVAHISAVDPDSGKNGELSCMLNDPVFRLQPLYQKTYKIVTAAALDREAVAEYFVEVMCTDHGNPTMSTSQTITIKVTDENDNTPIFDQWTYTAAMKENNAIGAIVTQVNATDLDNGDNGQVVYSLSDDADQYFNIDSSAGIVIAKVRFDYERLRALTFSVKASDKGKPRKSSTAIVSLSIIDVNDQVPRFSQASYSFGVTENKPIATDVGYVTASDLDSEPFNHIEYSFSMSSARDVFMIDYKTGKIRTLKVLDREANPVYYLEVIASNPGSPGMSSSASVTVHVADANDNSPIIDYPEHVNTSLQISNALPAGYEITRIQAHDQDIGPNGQVAYVISRGNEEGLFDLERSSGKLLVNKDLSSIYLRTFTLRLEVTDHGSPARVTITQIAVVVNQSVFYRPPPPAHPLPSPNNASGGGPVLSQSMIIVIALSSASAAVLILLIILLIYIRRQTNQRKRHTYRCRPEEQKMLRRLENSKHQGGPEGGSPSKGNTYVSYPLQLNSPRNNKLPPAKPKRVTYADDPQTSPRVVLTNNLYDSANRTASPTSSESLYWISHPSSRIQPTGPRRQTSFDSYDRRPVKRAYPFVGTSQGPASPRHCDKPDKDVIEMPQLVTQCRLADIESDSLNSEDMSNTDSGRGPSELDDTRQMARLSACDPDGGEQTGSRSSWNDNRTSAVLEDPENLPPPPPALLNNSSQQNNPPASKYGGSSNASDSNRPLPPDVVRNISPGGKGQQKPHVAPNTHQNSGQDKPCNKDNSHDIIDKLEKDYITDCQKAEDPQELSKAIDDVFFQDMVIKHKTLV